MSVPDPRIQELAETLLGTPLSLTDVCRSMGLPDDLTKEQAEQLDSEVFECACCGWWCSSDEAHDESGELICDQCEEEGT